MENEESKFSKRLVKNPLFSRDEADKWDEKSRNLLSVDKVVAGAKEMLSQYESLFTTRQVSASAAQGLLRKAQSYLEEEFKKRSELKLKLQNVKAQIKEAKESEKTKEEVSPYFTENSGVDEESKKIIATERELKEKEQSPDESAPSKEEGETKPTNEVKQDEASKDDGKKGEANEQEKPKEEPEKEKESGEHDGGIKWVDEGEKQLRALLLDCYKREGILLRQLAKVEKEARNRFLLFNESSERLEKGLQWGGDDIEVLNISGQNITTLATMMRKSPEQGQMFERSYSLFSRALAVSTDDEEERKLQLSALWNWAVGLGEHAERREGEEADKLFDEGVKKYDEYLYKIAPLPASEVRFSKAVMLHSQARNREQTLSRNSKRIDELYSTTVQIYKEIWEDEGKKTGNSEVDNFMIGVIVNYSMAVLNQARFRTINHVIFQPFPDLCLAMLRECKDIIHDFMKLKFLSEQEKPKEIVQKQLDEVEKFHNLLRFKDKMEDIMQNLSKNFGQ